MSDPVADMTTALIGALHDQLRAFAVPINVAQITAAVATAMDVVGYADLVAAISNADTLMTAVTGDYPAPLAATAAALTSYGASRTGLGGVNTEIP